MNIKDLDVISNANKHCDIENIKFYINPPPVIYKCKDSKTNNSVIFCSLKLLIPRTQNVCLFWCHHGAIIINFQKQ